MKNNLNTQLNHWKNKNVIKRMSLEEVSSAIAKKREELLECEEALKELRIKKEAFISQAQKEYQNKDESEQIELLRLKEEVKEIENENEIIDAKKKEITDKYSIYYAKLDDYSQKIKDEQSVKLQKYLDEIDFEYTKNQTKLLKQINQTIAEKENYESSISEQIKAIEESFHKQIETADYDLQVAINEEKAVVEKQKAAIDQIKSELIELQTQHQHQKQALEENYMNEKELIKKDFEENIEQLKAELLGLMNKNEALLNEYHQSERDFETTKEKLNLEYNQMLTRFEKEKTLTRREKERLQTDNSKKNEEYMALIKKLDDEYAKRSGELEALQELFLNEKKEHHNDFVKEFETLTDELKERYHQTIGKYDEEVIAFKKERDEKIEILQNQYNDELIRLNERKDYLDHTKAQMKLDFEDKLHSLFEQKKNIQSHIVQLDKDHQNTLNHLFEQITSKKKEFAEEVASKDAHYAKELEKTRDFFLEKQGEVLKEIANYRDEIAKTDYKVATQKIEETQKINIFESEYNQKENELENQIAALNDSVKREEAFALSIEKEMHDLKENYALKVENFHQEEEALRLKHETDLNALKEAQSQQIQALEAEYETLQASLLDNHNLLLDDLKRQYEEKETDLLAKYDAFKTENEAYLLESNQKLEAYKAEIQDKIAKEEAEREELLLSFEQNNAKHKEEIVELQNNIDALNKDHLFKVQALEKTYEESVFKLQEEQKELFATYKQKAFDLENEYSEKLVEYENYRQLFTQKQNELEHRWQEILDKKEKETRAIQSELDRLHLENEARQKQMNDEAKYNSERLFELQKEVEDLKLKNLQELNDQERILNEQKHSFKKRLEDEYNEIVLQYRENEEKLHASIKQEFDFNNQRINNLIEEAKTAMHANEHKHASEIAYLNEKYKQEKEKTESLKERYENFKVESTAQKEKFFERYKQRQFEVEETLRQLECEQDEKIERLKKEKQDQVDRFIYEQSLKEEKIASMQQELNTIDFNLQNFYKKVEELENLHRQELQNWVKQTTEILENLHANAIKEDEYYQEQIHQFELEQNALNAQKEELIRSHPFALTASIHAFEETIRSEKQNYDEKIEQMQNDYQNRHELQRSQMHDMLKLLQSEYNDVLAQNEEKMNDLRSAWQETAKTMEDLLNSEKAKQDQTQSEYDRFKEDSDSQIQQISDAMKRLETFYQAEKERIEAKTIDFDDSNLEYSNTLKKKIDALELKHQELSNHYVMALNDLRLNHRKITSLLEEEMHEIQKHFNNKIKEREETLKANDALRHQTSSDLFKMNS